MMTLCRVKLLIFTRLCWLVSFLRWDWALKSCFPSRIERQTQFDADNLHVQHHPEHHHAVPTGHHHHHQQQQQQQQPLLYTDLSGPAYTALPSSAQTGEPLQVYA